MNCPVCSEQMAILELNHVEIDHCFSCGGIWLDSGELELLMNGMEKRKELLNSFRDNLETNEKKRKCPVCDHKMKKMIYGIESQILLDKCVKDHGLWFDAGELQSVLKMGTFDKENHVLLLLKDIFRI